MAYERRVLFPLKDGLLREYASVIGAARVHKFAYKFCKKRARLSCNYVKPRPWPDVLFHESYMEYYSS